MTTGQITPSTALVTMELFACGYRGDDSHVPQLPSPERDALAELSNIAMARAANSLRQMVEYRVILSVRSADIVSKGLT